MKRILLYKTNHSQIECLTLYFCIYSNVHTSMTSSENNGNTSGSQQIEETSSAFEEGILVKLFECNILPWVTKRDKVELLNRLPLAVLSMKLFLLANVSNKSIKIEADGSWIRVGKKFEIFDKIWNQEY